MHLFAPMGKTPSIHNFFGMNGGDDETRTRDLCRDSVVRSYNNLQARGDCQTPRKSYKTFQIVGWVVGWKL